MKRPGKEATIDVAITGEGVAQTNSLGAALLAGDHNNNNSQNMHRCMHTKTMQKPHMHLTQMCCGLLCTPPDPSLNKH